MEDVEWVCLDGNFRAKKQQTMTGWRLVGDGVNEKSHWSSCFKYISTGAIWALLKNETFVWLTAATTSCWERSNERWKARRVRYFYINKSINKESEDFLFKQMRIKKIKLNKKKYTKKIQT